MSGEDYQSKYCSKCYWGDKACMIWFAHMEYNYEECNKDKSFLDLFIPRSNDGLFNEKCTMLTECTPKRDGRGRK